jgi:hypothetical protein
MFDLCHENDVGFCYTVRDIPALYEAAKASPPLWSRVQAIVTALHRHHHEIWLAADEIGLTGAYQENAAHQQAVVEAADAILREPATSIAVLSAKARVLVASRGLDLTPGRLVPELPRRARPPRSGAGLALPLPCSQGQRMISPEVSRAAVTFGHPLTRQRS